MAVPMEVERHAGALYTTFLVDPSGARALEFHGLYCWYLSGLDTLSVGNVLGRFLPHSRGFGAMVFPTPIFIFSFSNTLHNPTALHSESITSRITDHRATEKFDHLGVGTARAALSGLHSSLSHRVERCIHSPCCNVWLLGFLSHGLTTRSWDRKWASSQVP